MIFWWTPNKLFKDYVLNNGDKWSHLGCHDKRNTLLHCFHGDFFNFLSHKNVTLTQQCCQASAEQGHGDPVSMMRASLPNVQVHFAGLLDKTEGIVKFNGLRSRYSITVGSWIITQAGCTRFKLSTVLVQWRFPLREIRSLCIAEGNHSGPNF